jgi:acyl-CoA thioesterase YciA
MDLAGCVECKRNYPGRYVTITVDKMIFSNPFKIGYLLYIYCKIKTIGNTSITIDIIAKIKKALTNEIIDVTQGILNMFILINLINLNVLIDDSIILFFLS